MDKKPLSNCSNDAVDINRRSTNVRIFQNFILLWLDANINEDKNKNIITQLRQVINTVNTFTDVNQLVDFTTDIKDVKIFMIFSEEFAQTTIPIVHDMPQVSSIYIFCKNKLEHEEWSKQWPKIKNIFTEISQICEVLKQATRECDQNLISMSFVPTNNETLNKNLDQLDQSFMYTQILKEILLTIDFNQEHIMEFTGYCREKFFDNIAQLKNIDELEKEYDNYSPIWWYTSQCFLYSILNRGLRTMEVDIIIKMGFFVHHLHRHIEKLHQEQYAGDNQWHPFIVYRGQGLTQTDFDQMMKTKGGLVSFNNFLSTSRDRTLSLAFAESNQNNPDSIGVLFQITINPSISLIPFADISVVSHYQTEEEVLFSMHSVFRIGDIKEINGNNRLWEVELTLTRDNDPQLSALTEHIREETLPRLKGWHRLSQLLITLGQINKAQKVCEVLLNQTFNDYDRANIYHQLGSIKDDQANYEEAIKFYEKSTEMLLKYCPSNDPNLLSTYNNIGTVYSKMGDYLTALSYYKKVLEVQQNKLPRNDCELATSYISMGSVYEKLGKYTEALSFYEKGLDIGQKCFPSNHTKLADTYAFIGSIYEKQGEYSKALSYCEKSHEIYLKSLPPDHPDLAIYCNNIGVIYGRMEKYAEALTSYEKAVEIYLKTLDANHPQLAMTYLNIGSVYEKTNDSSKALSYYEKSCEVFQKTLPSNHPDLATSYSYLAGIYLKIGEYSKALEFGKRSLEIYIRTLPADHPRLATSYTNIALIYGKMGEYSKALTAQKKGFEIYQKTLPPNHPDLATSYITLGTIYYDMGNYSKALSFFQHADDTLQDTVSENHPVLRNLRTNIETIKKKV
jgi:tetratricopeptide (TPR) repeat protein